MLEGLFMERMDQNEEIFVRYMNDKKFQKAVTEWMASEAYRKLREKETTGSEADDKAVIPVHMRLVEPAPEERYVTCVPLVPFKAAAGAFSGA